MKRWLVTAAAALIPAAAFAQDQAEILKKIEAMQKQIAEQQVAIEALKAQLAVPAKAVTGPTEVAASPASLLALGTNIDGLKLRGDMRLRYEYRNLKDDTPGASDRRQKSRFRTRFRLGGVWQNSAENWEIGAGLATGEYDQDGGNHAGGTSSNDSWNESGVWETGDIGIDYAYAKHSWDCTSLTLGQQKNPFESTFIMFDGDLRPTGLTGAFDSGPVFATAGYYNLRSDVNVAGSTEDSNATLLAAQVGGKLDGEGVNGLLALGYYLYDDEATEYAFGGEGVQNNDWDDYQFKLLDLYGEIGVEMEAAKAKLYGECVVNTGANDGGAAFGNTLTQLGQPLPGNLPANYDADSNDTAWVLGGEVKAAGVKLSYAYARIEGDSVPLFQVDSDFGDGLNARTNVKGHKLGLSYGISKHCSLGATAFFVEDLETRSGANADDKKEHYQLDLKYKF